MNAVAKVVAINLLVALATLPILEMGMRLYVYGSPFVPTLDAGQTEPSRTRGWVLAPNRMRRTQTADYVTYTSTNAAGYRDRAWPTPKAPGVKRVALLGDSFMEGYYMPDRKAFHVQLQQRLGSNYDVMNFGVRGYGTTQELITAREDVARYRPEIVAVAFALNNDLFNNDLAWTLALTYGKVDYPRPPYLVEKDGNALIDSADYDRNAAAMATKPEPGPWYEQSVLYRSVLAVAGSKSLAPAGAAPTVLLPQFDPNAFVGEMATTFDPSLSKQPRDYATMIEHAWSVSCMALREIKGEAASWGGRVAVFTVPSIEQADGLDEVRTTYPSLHIDPLRPGSRLSRCADELGLDFVDLTHEFMKRRPDGRLYFPADRHWNENGVTAALDVVAPFIGALGSPSTTARR